MTDKTIVAVIMAGGSGKRFWPLSVPGRPKQFLKLFGEKSMLQATWHRLEGLVPAERRLVITAEEFAENTRADLPDLPAENLVGEPRQRDTAAAAILGAALARQHWPEAVVATLPADHLIRPADDFRRQLAEIARLADREQVLCAIGIRPTFPSAGYGYIERGERMPAPGEQQAYRVKRFTEKPDRRAAEQYIKAGSFYWNAGIFVWPAPLLLEEARQHMPGHYEALSAAAEAWGTDRWDQRFRAAYDAVEKVPVDVGIMEKTSRAAVVEARFSWSDLGGWVALGEQLTPDEQGNEVRGKALLDGCRNSVIYNTRDDRPVVCIGVSDAVVVHTEHGVLVCDKRKVEEVKGAVEALYEGDDSPTAG